MGNNKLISLPWPSTSAAYRSHHHFSGEVHPCSICPPFPFGQGTTTLPSTKNHFLHACFHCSHLAKSNSLAESDWAQTLIRLFSTVLTIRGISYLPQTSLFLEFGWFWLLEFQGNWHPTLEPSLCQFNTFSRTQLAATWKHFPKAPKQLQRSTPFCVQQLW